MSDLLKNINVLLEEAIASDRKTFDIYAKLLEAYKGITNEKFSDVV